MLIFDDSLITETIREYEESGQKSKMVILNLNEENVRIKRFMKIMHTITIIRMILSFLINEMD
jgi:hypothetical protein